MPIEDHDLPPCQILIDKDGRMYHQGAEMINQGINSFLLANLRAGRSGTLYNKIKGSTMLG